MSPVTPEKMKEIPVVKNAANVKKAVALGKDMLKANPEVTKADIALKMFELIHDEHRDIVAQAFVEGAGLTPKGAMTYVYNTKRKFAKVAKQASTSKA